MATKLKNNESNLKKVLLQDKQRISHYINILNNMDIVNNEYYRLYKGNNIDYYFYKAICLLKSYYLNESDSDKRVISDNMRCHNLFNNFMLYINKSSITLTLSALKRIVVYCRNKTRTLNKCNYNIKKYM